MWISLGDFSWPTAVSLGHSLDSKLWAGATTRLSLVTGLASGCQEVGKRMGLLLLLRWEAVLCHRALLHSHNG